MSGWPTEWDGLFRCEIHPAGTHATIELAEACINADPPVQELRLFDDDCICDPTKFMPDPECQFPHAHFLKPRLWS